MPGDSDIVEEEKHRAEGLVRILLPRHRRAAAQEAILLTMITALKNATAT